MLIAQITDLHVRPEDSPAYGRVNTNEMLRACVRAIRALDRQPDVLVATGDLTDGGTAEEVRILAEILAPLPMPIYVLPGNHDCRAALVKELPTHKYLSLADGFLHYAVDAFPVKLIALDTVVPGKSHGELCAHRLEWLEARLAERRDHPVVVMMHHPPFATGIHGMDRINCRNGAEMAAIIARYPNVERVICGHHHRPIQTRFGGTIGSVAPSPAHQVALNLLEEGGAEMFTFEPPAYHLHLWKPGVGLMTHQAYIGAFDGPHPFAEDPHATMGTLSRGDASTDANMIGSRGL